ncbi:MAG: hypothetical protein HWD85_03495 [Flavobacteriaceae bacterium]|nr:hypothetical protein [Flavobacteriaceae bacterium]
MKKLVVLFLGLTLSASTLVANNNPIEKAKEQLRVEITKLLGSNEFPLVNADIAKAEVSILVNSDNQLVIVSVTSENQFLVDYLKRKLNYKKVNVKAFKKMKIYKMPVKIIKA